MNTTKEIGRDFLLMPDENPKFKHDKKWFEATDEIIFLKNILKKLREGAITELNDIEYKIEQKIKEFDE